MVSLFIDNVDITRTKDFAYENVTDISSIEINDNSKSVLNNFTITFHDRQYIDSYLNNSYLNKNVAIIYDEQPVFDGKVIHQVLNDEKVTLTIQSNIALNLKSDLVYSQTNKSPVEAVKDIIEGAGGIVDEDSYTNVLNKINATPDFNYEQLDRVKKIDAINAICDLFRFFVYYTNGAFFFWEKSINNNTVMLNDVFNLSLETFSPKYTKLYIEWQGGTSLFLIDGDLSFGSYSKTLTVNDSYNIIVDNINNVNEIGERNSYDNGFSKTKVSFYTSQLIDLNSIVFIKDRFH